ncbi:thiol:disulfide interchange protein DsbD [Inhella inkyongensis]|uniref:Thiol:disulfide interchange protein DsbD n=1 Tax=Inhella inkyongensis TaxID=392593 RepID=A0A840SD30_9BURK|nr:protein-disulfide reductase DsbD [Inhella inkyongensis]MBB5206250.1 thiol:disulfide interchange protein DsbD [Inhella inkyongensis]
MTVLRSFVILLVGVLLGFAAGGASAEEFLEPGQAFKLAVRGQSSVQVQFEIAPGYYLYREQLKISDAAGQPYLLKLPDGKRKFDETFQKEVETYRDRLSFDLDVGSMQELQITAQGCADKGLCYPPMTVRVLKVESAEASWRIEPQVEGAPVFGAASWQAATSAGLASKPPEQAGQSGVDQGLAGLLGSGRWWAAVLGFGLAGLGLSLTPCVLPMLPILSSIIMGGARPVSRRRGFLLALCYSAGMVLVYTALGVAAGLAGEGLAAYLQAPWVLLSFATIMVLLALSMFGAYELQLPSGLQQRLTQSSQGLEGGRWVSVFVMGALSALIVGPCVAPPLAGALVYISQSRDVWLGGSALFALACGMSVPLLLLGLSAGSLLPKTGPWMERIKHLFGFGLLAVAIWLGQPALPWAFAQALWGAWMVGLAAMAWPHMSGPSAPARWLRQVLALALAFVGVLQWWGAAQGGTDPLRPVATAPGAAPAAAHSRFERIANVEDLEARLAKADRPVILDFYADWCVSCKEMERFTFADPQVAARMSGALLLQADVTRNSEEDRELLKRFKLFGPPAILFFDAKGQELEGLRVVGYQPPARFIPVLSAAGL